ncbi:HAD family hydrolase [Reinekea thalattae]|uniref:HAD family phosphatase n=1 Tax=Reinekea thalattae TaxID=2593301 RepID=A0A5C8Z8G8_9GAMM|nr:HAD family phosphatase [Reinekea thalattae]TXR53624.1 HAD family phosphatase [Reinekea thalattae]
MQIEAILWDMDGVLLDTERLCQQAFVEVNTPLHLFDNPAQSYLETIGLNRDSTLQWYTKVEPSLAQCERYYGAVRDRLLELIETDLQVKPGVEQALTYFKQQGLPQMVVTSSHSEQARLKLERTGLLDYFTALIGGDQVSCGKPHPEPYLAAASLLNVSPEHCLVIEDSANGVKAGLAAGAQVVHVPDLLATSNDWRDQLAVALDSLALLPDWFAGRGE